MEVGKKATLHDWAYFSKSCYWTLFHNSSIEVAASSEKLRLSHKAAQLFPPLAKLIERATVTDVKIDRVPHKLLGWELRDGKRCGWLCPLPSRKPPKSVCEDHAILLKSFGGIVERFNEFGSSWLLSHNDALTQTEAARDGSFLEYVKWRFEDEGLTLPIEPTEYYSIACEANANITLCHRTTGRVLLFAHDHYFHHVKVLKGCPDMTLYTIRGATTFRQWVNAISRQWLRHLAKGISEED